MEDFDNYSKDNRRAARNQAKADHFKNGKNKARCHKDKVVEVQLNSTQEAEISHLGFKVRKTLSDETLNKIKNSNFDTSYVLETILYSHKNEIKLDPIPEPIHEDGPDIEFAKENLINFIQEIDKSELKDWILINYANPTKPGGGFDKDASVYEESLVLSSGLYLSLKKCDNVYVKNRDYEESGLFRDDLIYSPNVPFFRDSDFNFLEDDDCYKISIISIPTVNYVKYSKTENFSEEDYEKNMRNKIGRIYRTALKHGHTKLILGPWGCGLEGGPLKKVIEWFSEDKLSDLFDQIYFVCEDEETVKIMQENF